MSSQSIRVAIVGGGISGLAFAIALARSGANVDVDIYESTATFGEVGAGIGFFPRILEDLRFLGFGDDINIEEKSLGGKHIVFMKGDEPDSKVWGGSKAPLQTLRRADFLDVLLKHLPTNFRTHFGKRLASYTDSAPEPVVLSFKDGSTATCDLLVGADGIKSATRKAMYQKLADAEPTVEKADELRNLIQPKWARQYVYKNLISSERLKAICSDHPALNTPLFFCGVRKYVVAYPVAQGRLINVSAVVQHTEKTDTVHNEPWSCVVSQTEVKAEFVGWSPYVQNLLDCMVEPFRWVLNSISDLPSYVSGRVAIIGDAAHAMTPHLGSGAGQGIEDGMLLATLLAQPQANTDQIPTILQIFDEIRRPFAQDVVRKSFRTGQLQTLSSEEVEGYSAEDSAAGKIPAEVYRAVEEGIANEGRWTYKTAAHDDRRIAVELLPGSYQGAVR